jgi:hypothetical protein
LEALQLEAEREREEEEQMLEQDLGKDSVGNWGWSRRPLEEEEEEAEEEAVRGGDEGLMVVLNKLDLHESTGQTESLNPKP